MCFIVPLTFYYILYAREDGQLFTIENHIDVLILHLAFLPRINQALNKFKESYNNQLPTESNRTPNQMWLNRVLNPSNPLAENLIDNDVDNAEVYGMDPEGPSPFNNIGNKVVTPELNLNRDIKIIWQFLSLIYWHLQFRWVLAFLYRFKNTFPNYCWGNEYKQVARKNFIFRKF